MASPRNGGSLCRRARSCGRSAGRSPRSIRDAAVCRPGPRPVRRIGGNATRHRSLARAVRTRRPAQETETFGVHSRRSPRAAELRAGKSAFLRLRHVRTGSRFPLDECSQLPIIAIRGRTRAAATISFPMTGPLRGPVGVTGGADSRSARRPLVDMPWGAALRSPILAADAEMPRCQGDD